MPFYSNIFQQQPSEQQQTTTTTSQYDEVDAQLATQKASQQTIVESGARASMKLLQDHHLLSKKRTKLAQHAASKVVKLDLQQLQQVGDLENRLWDPEDEYDPAIPNSYEALLAAGRVVMAPISVATKRNSNQNCTAKNESPQSIIKFNHIPPPQMSTATNNNFTDDPITALTTIPTTKLKQDEHETRVLLLQNMVGPGEVDDELQAETSEECKKYGQVIKCLIYEIPNKKVPDDEAVRIFVEFEDKEATKRAISDLNGRYFGGRVVRATYYSLERFQRYDLGSSGT